MMKMLTTFQVGKGKSIWSWPSGHATDSEEAIAFADLHGIDCLVKEFPLEQCNEAFGMIYSSFVDWFIFSDMLSYFLQRL